MTESKVDLLAWIRNTPADNGWKAKERDAVANAVAELIESIEAALNHSNHVCITQHGGKRSPEAAEHYERIRAALAACTPAKSEGR